MRKRNRNEAPSGASFLIALALVLMAMLGCATPEGFEKDGRGYRWTAEPDFKPLTEIRFRYYERSNFGFYCGGDFCAHRDYQIGICFISIVDQGFKNYEEKIAFEERFKKTYAYWHEKKHCDGYSHPKD
jgi:hypothetical protein